MQGTFAPAVHRTAASAQATPTAATMALLNRSATARNAFDRGAKVARTSARGAASSAGVGLAAALDALEEYEEEEEEGGSAREAGFGARVYPPGHAPPNVRVLGDKDRAHAADMEYARFVAGGMHVRSLGSVWGPRDGSGLNAIDTKRLQDEVFQFITEKLQDRLDEERARREAALQRQRAAAQGPPPARPVVLEPIPPLPTMAQLAQLARTYRDDFNNGWNVMKDVGILNEAVAAEVEVLHMLRKAGAIRSWDGMLEGLDPMPRIRLLRRCTSTRAAFGTTVGSVLVNSMQSRPTVRPTSAIMQRTAVDTALQFKGLLGVLQQCRGALDAVMHAHAVRQQQHSETRDAWQARVALLDGQEMRADTKRPVGRGVCSGGSFCAESRDHAFYFADYNQ